MKISEWIDYLSAKQQRIGDINVAAMFISPEEIYRICGERYNRAKVDRMIELLSRKIGDDFWYDKREIFNDLIRDAYDCIEESDADDRVRIANDKLTQELGLNHLLISLGYEIRPMKEVNKKDLVVSSYGEFPEFTLPANSNYATFLKEMDDRMSGCGDHRFLEGWGFNEQAGKLEVYFGS